MMKIVSKLRKYISRPILLSLFIVSLITFIFSLTLFILEELEALHSQFFGKGYEVTDADLEGVTEISVKPALSIMAM